MTAEEVKELIHSQAAHGLALKNHGMTLEQALIQPQRITVIERITQAGGNRDRNLDVWLVGQENSPDGYKIVLREDGMQFGLASGGFASDKHPILVGWYGSLKAAFLGM
jgi:hypothetical protein